MRPLVLIAAVFATGLASCGDDIVNPPVGSSATSSSSSTSESLVQFCTRDDVDGCDVFGFVLTEAAALEPAIALVGVHGGTAIAIYRADSACVLERVFGPPLPDEPRPQVASRFAYVDAGQIRVRRLNATGSGQSPPITGIHISESYWNHWEDQWARAQEKGVMVSAVTAYLPLSRVDDVEADVRIGSVVMVPSRRTDSLDLSYPGELLLREETFPEGHLDPIEDPAC